MYISSRAEREREEIASVMKEEDRAVLQSRLNKKRKHPLGAQARPKNVLHSSSYDIICMVLVSWTRPLPSPALDVLHHQRGEGSGLVHETSMVRPSPARRYIQCTATRDIFRRPHEESSAHSGTTCIIIAESAKQIHSVCLSPVSRKAKFCGCRL